MSETENNKIEDKKKEYTTTSVPKDPHKDISKLAIDFDKDIKEMYDEIIPLGLRAWVERHSNISDPNL